MAIERAVYLIKGSLFENFYIKVMRIANKEFSSEKMQEKRVKFFHFLSLSIFVSKWPQDSQVVCSSGYRSKSVAFWQLYIRMLICINIVQSQVLQTKIRF